MISYTSDNSVFNDSIYIFNTTDLVLGGLAGTSNIPLKSLADNTGYLQKFKGRVIRGSGIPTSSTLTGFETDSDTTSNILYLDELTGSFWKPDNTTGTTWTNIYKSAIMNIKGVNINNNGDDTSYVNLSYDSVSNLLEIKEDNGTTYATVRVGKVIYDTIDGASLTQSHIADQEVLLLFDITSQTENTDAYYSAKRLDDISELVVTEVDVNYGGTNTADKWTVTVSTGVISDYLTSGDYVQIRGIDEDTGEEINGYYKVNSINDSGLYFTTYATFKAAYGEDKTVQTGSVSLDNSAMIMWDESEEYWKLQTRDGILVPLSCAGFYINGVANSFITDRCITTTTQFDEIFSNVDTGETVCYLKKPEDNYVSYIENEYIVLKPNVNTVDGSYTLDNIVEICGSNIRIECICGANIKYTADGGIRTRNDTNLEIDNYMNIGSGTQVSILSSNTQYTNGENNTDQVVIENNDNVVVFSEGTVVENKKYTVTDVYKNVNVNFDVSPGDTGSDESSMFMEDGVTNISTGHFHATDFEYSNNKYIIYVYENNTQADLGYGILKYNTATKIYEFESAADNGVTSGQNSIRKPRIFIDTSSSRIHVVWASNTDNQEISHSWSVMNTPSFAGNLSSNLNLVDDNNNEKPILYSLNDTLYLIYMDSNKDIIFIKSLTSPVSTGTPYTWNTATTISTVSVLSASNMSISVLGSKVLITYVEDSGLLGIYAVYSINGGSSFSRIILYTTSNATNQYMVLTDSNFYIIFDDNISGTQDTVQFVEIDFSGSTPSIGTPVLAIYKPQDEYNYFDFRINTLNEYTTTSTKLFQILAFNVNNVYSNTVNTSDTSGEYNKILINSNNEPLIYYYNSTDGSLCEARWDYDDEAWFITEIYNDVDSGNYIGACLDNDGYPAVSSVDIGVGDLILSRYNGTSWSSLVLLQVDIADNNTAITFDKDNNYWIAFIDETVDVIGPSLWIRNSSGSTELAVNNIVDGVSLATDFDGYPMLVYHQALSGNPEVLYFVKYNGMSWNSTVIDNTGINLIGFTSIILNKSNYPSVAYYDATNKIVKYASYNGVTWDIEDVITDANITNIGNLTMDSNGDIYISFSDSSLGIRMAYLKRGTWRIYTIGSGTTNSIAIDNEGYPILAGFATPDVKWYKVGYTNSFTSAVSTDSGVTWSNKTLFLEDNDWQGYIGGFDNNKLFPVLYNASGAASEFDDTNWLLNIQYAFYITLDKVIETKNLIDLILSHNYIENLKLNLKIDGDNQTVTDILKLGNSYETELELDIENGVATDGIDGEDKCYAVNVKKLYIDSDNTITNNITNVNHSLVNNINIYKTTKNFNSCENLVVTGFIEGESIIATGDFNE